MNTTNNDLVLSRAKAAVLARDFEQAVRLYKTLLSADSRNIIYLSQLASAYVRAGEDTKALKAYQNVLSVDEGNFDALINLGGIYRRLSRYDESLSVLTKALASGRKPNIVYYNLGFTYKSMGKFDKAAECFDAVIEVDPNDVLAYNHLGSIYAMRGQHMKAVATYQRGLEIDPNHPILHYNAAMSYVAFHKFDNAKKSFENALRSKPGWLDAVNGYSDLLLKMRKNNAAKELLSQAAKLNPNNSHVHSLLGKADSNMGNLENAQIEFETALELDDKNCDAMSGLAKVFEKNRKYDNAKKLLEKAIYTLPNEKKYKLDYASLLLKAGKISAADNAIQNILDKNVNDLDGLNLKGQSFIRKDQDDMAQDCFNKIVELNSSYKDWMRDSASVYHELGKYSAAEQKLLEYLESAPSDSDALSVLAANYEALGKYQDSLSAYKTAARYDTENVSLQKAVSRLSAIIETGAYSPDASSVEISQPTPIEEIEDDGIFDTSPVVDQTVPPVEQITESQNETSDSSFEEDEFSIIPSFDDDAFKEDDSNYFDEMFNYDLDQSENENLADDEDKPEIIDMDELVEQDAPIEYDDTPIKKASVKDSDNDYEEDEVIDLPKSKPTTSKATDPEDMFPNIESEDEDIFSSPQPKNEFPSDNDFLPTEKRSFDTEDLNEMEVPSLQEKPNNKAPEYGREKLPDIETDPIISQLKDDISKLNDKLESQEQQLRSQNKNAAYDVENSPAISQLKQDVSRLNDELRYQSDQLRSNEIRNLKETLSEKLKDEISKMTQLPISPKKEVLEVENDNQQLKPDDRQPSVEDNDPPFDVENEAPQFEEEDSNPQFEDNDPPFDVENEAPQFEEEDSNPQFEDNDPPFDVENEAPQFEEDDSNPQFEDNDPPFDVENEAPQFEVEQILDSEEARFNNDLPESPSQEAKNSPSDISPEDCEIPLDFSNHRIEMSDIPDGPYKKTTEMFLFIRHLCDSLPNDKKEVFLASKICIQLDYLISRLLGEKGLLEKASLHSRIDDVKNKKTITDSNIIETLGYMRTLVFELPDKYRAAALDSGIADVLEDMAQSDLKSNDS